MKNNRQLRRIANFYIFLTPVNGGNTVGHGSHQLEYQSGKRPRKAELRRIRTHLSPIGSFWWNYTVRVELNEDGD